MTESNENTNKQTVLLGEKTLDEAIESFVADLDKQDELYKAARAIPKDDAALIPIRDSLLSLISDVDMNITIDVLNVLIRAFNMLQMAERSDGSTGLNRHNAPPVIAAIRSFADITVDSITSTVEHPDSLLSYAADIQDEIVQSSEAHAVNVDLLKENGGEDDE